MPHDFSVSPSFLRTNWVFDLGFGDKRLGTRLDSLDFYIKP